MLTIEDTNSWRGHDARGSDGVKLGKIEDIHLGRETGKPERMAVKTGLFGGHVNFRPLAEAHLDGDAVTVPSGPGHDQGRPARRRQLSQRWRRRT
jgi:sporulation protein YlmC with PRC-barrel domain